MRNTTIPVAAIAAALILGACSKSAPAPETPQPQSAVAASNPASTLPQPDASTPDQSYVQLETPLEVLALDGALSSPKYEVLARASSPEYRSTQDSFKQHDLLTGLQPQFDAAITRAKSHPYVTWILPFPQIGHFDFTTHTFPVSTSLFQPGGATQFFEDGQPYAAISVTNGAAFKSLHVPDETKARAMEAMVTAVNGLRLKVFAFAQATDDSGTPTVKTTITKVQVLDSHDHVLIEQAAP